MLKCQTLGNDWCCKPGFTVQLSAVDVSLQYKSDNYNQAFFVALMFNKKK